MSSNVGRNVLIFILLVCLGSPVKAQSRSELSLGGAAGISWWRYKAGGAKRTPGSALDVRFGYTYMFPSRSGFLPQWGLSTGLELAFYNSKATFSDYTDSYNIVNPNYLPDYAYTITETLSGQERHYSTFLNIPLMLRYTFRESPAYIAGGVKISIPLSATYKSTFGQATLTGYSEQTGQIHENEPEYGFTTYSDVPASGDIELKAGAMLALEAGWRWALSKHIALYTGLYFDYGLTNFSSKSDGHLNSFDLDAPAELHHSSVLNTKSGSVAPAALGVVVRMTMNRENKRAYRYNGCECEYKGALQR